MCFDGDWEPRLIKRSIFAPIQREELGAGYLADYEDGFSSTL
jgi:hypothetical protein